MVGLRAVENVWGLCALALFRYSQSGANGVKRSKSICIIAHDWKFFMFQYQWHLLNLSIRILINLLELTVAI